MRITHIGGPTALIELDGWRLLTDPTFDDPGRRYAFGWGTSSRKLAASQGRNRSIFKSSGRSRIGARNDKNGRARQNNCRKSRGRLR